MDGELDNNLSIDLAQNIANIYDVQGEYFSVLLGENGDPIFFEKGQGSHASCPDRYVWIIRGRYLYIIYL